MNCWLEGAERYARETPDAKAVSAQGQTVTYRQLIACAKALAARLSDVVHPGDVVICRASQTVTYVIWYCAVLYCGGIFAPLENDCPQERFWDIASSVHPTVVVGFDTDGNAAPMEIEEAMAHVDSTPDRCACSFPLRAESDAQLLFTSGSTGRIKGALSANRMLTQAEGLGAYLQYDTKTSLYLFAPVNHVAFFLMAASALCHGAHVVLSQGLTNMPDLMRELEQGVNTLHATPSVMRFLLRRCGELLEQYSAQIKCVTLAGEKCPADTQYRLKEMLPTASLYVFYGSTETGHVANYRFSHEPIEENCVGYPSAGVELRLLSERDQTRIGCKTPFGMKRYMDGEEVPEILMTDDRGHIKDGKLYVEGRISDMIISGGHKIDPHEVERIAKAYPAIEECVCVPAKDALMGSTLKLIVQFRGAQDCDGLTEYLYSRLEAYKVPRMICPEQSIWKNANGKVDRKHYIGREPS